MARRLRVFQAHLGFYDTVVAAPSRKAALEAWGAGAGEFAKGFAKVTQDPAAIDAAIKQPGTVLKRPYGSSGAYKAEADLPSMPKLSAKARKAVRAHAARRKKMNASEHRAAERELREARRDEARVLAELRSREAELEREKAAARETARNRIARARDRLARRSR